MFFRMLVTMGVGLFTSREILRILGVEDFGTYNLVGTIVVMFAFLQNALNNATSRYITFELGTGVLENLQRTFSMSINSEILLSVIVLVLSELVGPYFIETHLNIPEGRQMAAHVVYQLSLFNFVIGIIRTPFNALIIAHERMDYYAYTSIVEAILKLLVVYFLAVISYDKLIVFAFLLVGVSIIIFLWMYIYCKHHFEECKYSRVWDVKLFKKLTNYSGLSLLVNFCDVAVMQSITIFFNIFSGVVANAALGVANQVNTHLNNFLGNFSQSYSPQIIKSYAAEEYDYFMKLIFSASKLSYFLLFSVAFPVMLNIDYILDIWLVNPPGQAGLFLCLIVCYSLIDAFSQPLFTSVHATGNLKVHQLLMGGIKILNIPLSYMLIKQGCPTPIILVVWAAMNGVCGVARIWWLQYLINLNVKDFLGKTMWPILYISLLTAPLPILIKHSIDEELISFMFSTLIFLFSFLPLVYLLALNTAEKKMIQELWAKVLKRVRHL